MKKFSLGMVVLVGLFCTHAQAMLNEKSPSPSQVPMCIHDNVEELFNKRALVNKINLWLHGDNSRCRGIVVNARFPFDKGSVLVGWQRECDNSRNSEDIKLTLEVRNVAQMSDLAWLSEIGICSQCRAFFRKSLQTLIVHGTNIDHIDSAWFEPLCAIEHLDLSQNSIELVDWNELLPLSESLVTAIFSRRDMLVYKNSKELHRFKKINLQTSVQPSFC